MIYRVAKKAQFSAAHCLKGLPDRHPCASVHGHNFEVEVGLSGQKPVGQAMLVDFRVLGKILDEVTRAYDHSDLNLSFPNPTCEEIALAILLKVRCHMVDRMHDQGLRCRVRVSEGPTSWAEVEDR